MVTLESLLQRNPAVMYAPLGEKEAVLMSVQAGHYFSLDEVGRRVFELLETPQTLRALCSSLCSEFEVSSPVCEQELTGFVDELLANGVLIAS